MNKVLMIGLDGATFDLLQPLMDDGVMPFLQRFMAEGCHGDLMSTRNPLTPPAWVSMTTGRSPHVHGIYDFLRPVTLEDGTVFLKVNDFRDNRSETVWPLRACVGAASRLNTTSLSYWYRSGSTSMGIPFAAANRAASFRSPAVSFPSLTSSILTAVSGGAIAIAI